MIGDTDYFHFGERISRTNTTESLAYLLISAPTSFKQTIIPFKVFVTNEAHFGRVSVSISSKKDLR